MGAQGSQSGISIRAESTWGVLDAGQFASVNFTAEDMAYNIENNTSNNVRPDRQTVELVQVGADTSGGFETEFQAVNLDALLPAFLWIQDWVSPGTVTAAVAAAATANTFTFDAGDTIDIVPGQYIHMAGYSNAANNGFHFVTAVSGQVVTVATTLVTEAATTPTMSGHRITNGVYRHSFSIERSHNDVSQFFLYKGMVANTMEVNFESGEPVTCNLQFVGKDETLTQTTNSTPAASSAPTKPIFNATSTVGEMLIDGVAVAGCLIQSVNFTLDNQTEGKTGVGTLGFCDAVGRSIDLTGEIVMYFNDETYYEKYLNSTSFGLTIQLVDGDGNMYAFHLPKVKFNEGAVNVTGKDDDVNIEGSFVAIMDDTDEYTICISRYLA